MARRSKKRDWSGPHRELPSGFLTQTRHEERGGDGRAYQVQRVRGGQKEYTCPGCLQTIPPGTAHTVAWPSADSYLGAEGWQSGVEARRHWHNACWQRRLRPH